jgi:hypothetical protein
MFSVLLHVGMGRYILHIQKHTLLHSWTLDVTHGSTMHQGDWMLPSFMHLLYVLYNMLKIFKSPPPMVQQPLVSQAFLIIMASWSHSDTPHSCNTPLDKWSARGKDLDLTTHSTQKRQTSMPLTGFELTISASKRPHTHALGCAATGIDQNFQILYVFATG